MSLALDDALIGLLQPLAPAMGITSEQITKQPLDNGSKTRLPHLFTDGPNGVSRIKEVIGVYIQQRQRVGPYRTSERQVGRIIIYLPHNRLHRLADLTNVLADALEGAIIDNYRLSNWRERAPVPDKAFSPAEYFAPCGIDALGLRGSD